MILTLHGALLKCIHCVKSGRLLFMKIASFSFSENNILSAGAFDMFFRVTRYSMGSSVAVKGILFKSLILVTSSMDLIYFQSHDDSILFLKTLEKYRQIEISLT